MMKRLVLKYCLTALLGVIALQFSAQQRIESSAVNMEFEIPKRFMKISVDDHKTVYQDSKTKAIFTMEKLGFSDFETEILLQIEMDYSDLSSDENNIDLEEQTQMFRISEGYIINWKTVKRTRYRDNDCNRQTLMQLNGTLYRFTISYPGDKEKSVLALYNKTLNSAVPIYE